MIVPAALALRRSALLGALALCAFALSQAHAAGAVVVSHKVSSGRAAIEYWTPERMQEARTLTPHAQATPLGDPVLAAPSSIAPEGPPVAIPGRDGFGARSVSPDLETSPAGDTAYPQRIHGKIFATLAGVGDFGCSGTVITSPLRNLIVTAGHCVFGAGQNNDFATNFVFIPGYRNSNAPLGVWPATNLYTLAPWANGGAFSSDLGMARVAPVGGQQIETELGSRGVAFNQDPGQVFDHFGYPARPNASNPQDGFGDYDSERLIVCDNAATQGIEDLGDGPSIGSAFCFMQQGSSGGGWVIGSTERYVNSVVSHGYCQNDPAGSKTVFDPNTGTGRCGIFFGPYFGDGASALYDLATGVPKGGKKKRKKCKRKRKGKGKRKKCKRKKKRRH